MIGLPGKVIKKLAMSWVMPSLALLLHIALTMIDYVIVFNMYLEIYVTGQFQPKIYLA